jgi:hypothetical protein
MEKYLPWRNGTLECVFMMTKAGTLYLIRTGEFYLGGVLVTNANHVVSSGVSQSDVYTTEQLNRWALAAKATRQLPMRQQVPNDK